MKNVTTCFFLSCFICFVSFFFTRLPTAFLVLICLFVDLVAHMSNTIVHWPDDAVGFVLGYFCNSLFSLLILLYFLINYFLIHLGVVISVLSLALINNIVLACGLICWMCQKGKNSDSADHKSKKSERYKSTLLHLALLSMNCFIAGSLQFPVIKHLCPKNIWFSYNFLFFYRTWSIWLAEFLV